MTTKESTKAFLPLSIENDTHFNCTETFTPSISWQYTDKTDKVPTQWTGHLRIPSDGVYTISANIDDNGFIEIAGVKVINLEGHNSVRTLSAQVELKAGYHRIVLQHQDLAPLNPNYDNAMEFTPKLNNQPMVVHKVMAPVSFMKRSDAEHLMSLYNKYNYIKMKKAEDVYNKLKGTVAPKYGQSGYTNSCALRVTQALCEYGVTLSLEKDEWNPGKFLDGENDAGQVVYFRAKTCAVMFKNLLKPVSYETTSSNKASIKAACAVEEASTDDNEAIVLWINARNNDEDLVNHVAFGYKGEGDSGDLNYTNAYRIWILYSPLYEEPDNSVDFNNVPTEE